MRDHPTFKILLDTY